MSSYARPDVLVSTDWVKEHLEDPSVRLIEVDVDTRAYDAGHVPGSVAFDWQTQLQDQTRRDIISKEQFEQLLSKAGVTREATVVLYGDHSNWFACYAFWLFKMYGHRDVRLMNGGRAKWLDEDDKPFTTEASRVEATSYTADDPDPALRARIGEVLEAVRAGTNLVDVRSPDEFTGKIIAPPGMSETAQRAGHIPGAKNVPWSSAVNPDGTFKEADELRAIYLESQGLDPDRPTIAYCRIGERSSHTWFVLTYLLGIKGVKNYDGSWTEYGNLIGVPIER